MKKFSVGFVIILLILFVRCTPQLSDEVCNVGATVCEISESICSNYDIPAEVCVYLDLACLNINALCSMEPGTDEYENAKMKLDSTMIELKKAVETHKIKSDSLKIN